MLSHPQISPILLHTVPLNSPCSYRSFLCKNPKSVSHLHLNPIIEEAYDEPGPERKLLQRIFKSLKYTKRIQQNDSALERARLSASKTRSLVKRVQRVKSIHLKERTSVSQSLPIRLDLWLQYGKNLKSVRCDFGNFQFRPGASIPENGKQFKRVLRWIPQQHRLEALKIKLPLCPNSTCKSLLEFKNYPLSIKSFAIYQQIGPAPQFESPEGLIKAFSRLKNLESLTLSVQALVKAVLMLPEKLPNLKKLNLQDPLRHPLPSAFPFGNPQFIMPQAPFGNPQLIMPQNPFGNPQLIMPQNLFGNPQPQVAQASTLFSLGSLQVLQNLKHLKISNIDMVTDLNTLTKVPELESLDVEGTFSVQALGIMSRFISLFTKSLKKLKIDICHAYEAQTEESFKNLFDIIPQIETLTALKLKIENTASPFAMPRVTISPEIIDHFKGLFTKDIKLESFEWDLPRVSSPEAVFNLMNLLEQTAKTLKKVIIRRSFLVSLEKSEEVILVNFLRKLESIERLSLNFVEMRTKAFWDEVIDIVTNKTALRSLVLGIGHQGFEEDWLVDSLVKIARKRGLEELRILPGTSFVSLKQPLDLDEVMKINPSLKSVSNSIRGI